jgi:hypothetical protein
MAKSILDMVHGSARDLHAAGVIKDTTLWRYSPHNIRLLDKSAGISHESNPTIVGLAV